MNVFLFCSALISLVSTNSGGETVDARSGDIAAVAIEDSDLQGEYVGRRKTRRGWQRTGLQIIALGNEQFSAREYAGGLPGDGADLGLVTTYAGSCDGGRVVLLQQSGERIEADGRVAHSAAANWSKVRRQSPTLGLRPPQNATVVFQQSAREALLEPVKLDSDGSLLAGATTNFPVGDFYMHLEFRTPYMPTERGQGRGNSGVYIQRRYEVQILDSFGLTGEDNECGGLYKQRAPQQNMCFPPGTWQTYDIYFTAARWDSSGNKAANAMITVYHNGVAVHYQQEVTDKTGSGEPESPQQLPISLQDHGNPVTFRNIWIAPNEQGQRTTSQNCPPRTRSYRRR